jgi:hypothetical protein
MLQGLLQLGRATKHDEKKTHRTYTLLWPVFQKAAEGTHAINCSIENRVMHQFKDLVQFIIVQNITSH